MFASLALLLLAVTFVLLLFPTRRPKNFPPGPRAVPVLGNLLDLNLESPIADLERVRLKPKSQYSCTQLP